MHDENPYEVSPECELRRFHPSIDDLVNVEPTGTFLVCPNDTALPMRCVFTNVPTNVGDFVDSTLKWKGPGFRFLLRRTSCRLQYFVSSDIRRMQTRCRILIRLTIVIAMLAAALTILLLRWQPIALGALALVVQRSVSALASRKLPEPLTIADYRDGRFWIKGCSKEFLLELREELGL